MLAGLQAFRDWPEKKGKLSYSPKGRSHQAVIAAARIRTTCMNCNALPELTADGVNEPEQWSADCICLLGKVKYRLSYSRCISQTVVSRITSEYFWLCF